MNFGAIGLVMGHELTHGFDTQGRKYDKDGNMNDWWLNATAEAYEAKAQCMIDQYSQYKVEDLNVSQVFFHLSLIETSDLNMFKINYCRPLMSVSCVRRSLHCLQRTFIHKNHPSNRRSGW